MAVELTVDENGNYLLNGLIVNAQTVAESLCGLADLAPGKAPASVAVIEGSVSAKSLNDKVSSNVTPAPILSDIPPLVHENTDVVVNILNYVPGHNYNITITDGASITLLPGDNFFTIRTPKITANAPLTISVTAYGVGGLASDTTTASTTVVDNISYLNNIIFNNDFEAFRDTEELPAFDPLSLVGEYGYAFSTGGDTAYWWFAVDQNETQTLDSNGAYTGTEPQRIVPLPNEPFDYEGILVNNSGVLDIESGEAV